MEKKRAIMVALSASVLIPVVPSDVLAQAITCPIMFRFGNIVKCSGSGAVTIEPNGSLKNTKNCAHITNAPQPAVCTVSSGGTPVTKAVKVTFAKKSAAIVRGGETILLDKLVMTYTGKTVPAAKLTLGTTEVNKVGGVTIKIGGRINLTANSTIGQYTGNIVVNAN